MTKVKLGSVLKEEKTKIGKTDGGGLDLIGVSNEFGLHVSRAQRIADLSRYKIIKTGWLAYNPMRVNVGSIGIAKGPEHEGIVSPDYVVFSCTEKILPDYLLFFLKSDLGLEAINKNASGAVRKRLYYSDLARIELNVPSIERQNEILGSLKKIEAMVSQLRDPKRLEKVSQLKQSILQEAIQGKLTEEWREFRQAQQAPLEPASELLKRIQAEKAKLIKEKKIKKEKPLPPITESEKPFELPEGWEWCRLGEICERVHYGFNASAEPEKKDVRLLRITDIQNNQVKWETVPGCTYSDSDLKNYLLEIGDIVIARTGGTIGKSFLVTDTPVLSLFASYLIRVKPVKQMNSPFLKFFLESPEYWSQLYSAAWGAGQPNVNGTALSNLQAVLPPLEEQQAIVEKVESLMEKCRALEEEISQSEQHAQMLMQAVLKEAFEG